MRRFAIPVLIGILGVAALMSLGFWQVQRLTWKEAILDEITTRIAAEPVPVPDHPDPERDQYLPVTASGEITDEEVHVLVSTREIGAAFRIIALFRTDDGRRLLLDRGVVPEARKDEARAPVKATVTGNLLWPRETDMFTPDPDRETNLWFARDAEALSRELAAEPFLIVVRETSETEPPVTPHPVDSVGIPNDHLEYAITWFGLAAVWAGMTVLWMMRIARGKG
jgi:surfeit locus 1 family protein